MPNIEDRKLTPKENYLRILDGQMPEWAPVYTFGAPMPNGERTPLSCCTPMVLNDPHGQSLVIRDGVSEGTKDCWGVTWVGSYGTGGALLPEPGNYILEDIDDWHDVIKAPDISDVDWEDMCCKTLDAYSLDRDMTALGLQLYGGAFTQLVAFMGWTGALVAMIEEPEEAAELCKYVNDFYIEVGRRCMPYLEPDVLVMADDTCSAKAPFMDEGLFRQILLPTYKEFNEQLAEPYGIPVQFHNCGTAAHYIEICHEELNVTGWDPAQTMNDLVGFKEKWGRDIAIIGGYDAKGELLDPDCPDELIAESVRPVFDLLAPEGGFVFHGIFYGTLGDPRIAHKNEVLWSAASKYGSTFYD